MLQGTIFSIEEFALNDGPGIRTTVFLKGCPLGCVWCHNPEGIAFTPQLMKTAEGERTCGEIITTGALVERLLRHSEFLEQTGGGVTFTGGEPLAQPAFLEELLRKLAPVHRAIETSGYAPTEIFRRIISLADLTLFDIKTIDAGVHKKYTGADNNLILRNLQWLCESGKDFIIRLPLIPGVNDSLEAMEAVLEIIRDAPSLLRVEMLRYHRTAGAKYAMIGLDYSPPFDTGAEVEVHNVFENFHIKTIIL